MILVCSIFFMSTPENPFFQISLPPEFYQYLDQRIARAVDAALKGPAQSKLFTRKEVCQRLAISLPTLSRYVKIGVIKSRRIGTRVLFSESDIQDALKKANLKDENLKIDI
jgi:excisionase family DNA binding protein